MNKVILLFMLLGIEYFEDSLLEVRPAFWMGIESLQCLTQFIDSAFKPKILIISSGQLGILCENRAAQILDAADLVTESKILVNRNYWVPKSQIQEQYLYWFDQHFR